MTVRQYRKEGTAQALWAGVSHAFFVRFGQRLAKPYKFREKSFETDREKLLHDMEQVGRDIRVGIKAVEPKK